MSHDAVNSTSAQPGVAALLPHADPHVVACMYRSMIKARYLEDALIAALNGGAAVEVGHPTRGQEGVSAGVCAALTTEDLLYCGHRAKHWALAKGCSINRVAAEYYGKRTGLANGWGGEMRMMDVSVGFLGSTPVVGNSLPLAVGSALAARLDDADRVSVVAFGDGATVQGAFHESLNLAAVWQVPVLFVCENNQYAQSTSVEYFSRPTELFRKASIYGMETVRVDGQDACAIFDVAATLIAAMRADHAPRFLEAVTYRYLGHFYGDNTARYRPADEEAIWLNRDPIPLLEQRATVESVQTKRGLERIRAEVRTEIDDALRFSYESEDPDPQELARGGRV